MIINRGDIANIVATCSKIVPYLLRINPEASFGFMGGISIDRKSINKKSKQKRAEKLQNNQRFRLYRNFIVKRFGTKTFTHIEYADISSYVLLNNIS